ncbi:MAG: sulfite exporter TauE/SafE family protein [Spirochaetales bacterium]|nr:sulfite exporter TauE/SafE family protein [Spirochaetales bacterium]
MVTPNPVIAFFAGLASFLSPCIFPLIPSYLSFVSGVSFDELKAEDLKKRFNIFIQTLLFVAGFTVVFMLFGVLTSGIGAILPRNSIVVNVISGAIIIVFGLHFIFDFLKFLNIEKKFSTKKMPTGKIGAFLLGIAFGAGWTPCTGPFLGSIITLASISGEVAEGFFLLACYSLGLGIPFLLAGLFFSIFFKYMQRIKPHLKKIKIAGGIFLVLIGVLILVDRLNIINEFIFQFSNTLQSINLRDPWINRLIFGVFFGIFAVLILAFYIIRILKSGKTEEGTYIIGSLIRPVRMAFLLFFLVLSILSFTGVLDFASLIYSWANSTKI